MCKCIAVMCKLATSRATLVSTSIMTTHSQHVVPSYYILAHHLNHAPSLNTLIPRPTHHLASSLHHMPSHSNHTLHHILLPPSLKPYKFTPCISTWPACSNAHNILLTDHCHSPHISQGYTSPTRHCTSL